MFAPENKLMEMAAKFGDCMLPLGTGLIAKTELFIVKAKI